MPTSARTLLTIWATMLVVIGLGAAAMNLGEKTLDSSSAPALTTDVADLDSVGTATAAVATPALIDPVVVSAPAAPAPAAVAETWAVIVGADDYHGRDITLAAGISDAQATAHALDIAFGVDAAHRTMLLGDDVTRTAILDALGWLVSVAGPEDNAVFFYAGHVYYFGGDDHAFFLPNGDTLSDVDLAAALINLEAANTWLPIAGCYAAGFDELLAPGRILTAASAADELSYENLDFGHSYLVKYLMVDGLSAGNATSVEGAFDYATNRLAAEFPNRMPLEFDQTDTDFVKI